MSRSASRPVVAHAATVICLTIICLLVTTPGISQDCIDYSQYMHWVTSQDIEGTCNAVAIAGHHAYVACLDPEAALQVLDLSAPEDPQIVGGVALPGWCEDVAVAVARDLAFTANLADGLQVIDISDPTAPAVLSSVLTPDAARYVAVHGDFVVVAEWNTGLVLVVDVSDPSTPTILGSVQCEDDIRGLDVANGYAYSVFHTPYPGNAGLQVIDLADPAQPVIVADLVVGSWAWDVTVADGHAFITDSNGLEIFDVSDPTAPVLIGTGERGGRDIAIAGDLAFVGSGIGDTGVWV